MVLTTTAGCEFSCDIGDTPEENEVSQEDDPYTETDSLDGLQAISYENQDLGIAVKYPANWIYDEGENVVTFSGAEGTDEFFTTLTIQNLLHGDLGYPDIQSVFEDVEGQIKGAGGEILTVEEDIYYISEMECPIINFEAVYTMEGEENRQIVTIIEREDHDIFHMITYHAAEDLFENSFDIATNIFNSLELI